MKQSSFDLVVIGAGPGGYVAAIRAAQLGLNVAIVEREHLGGVCLNWGCIPTKALLRSAEVLRIAQEAEIFGVDLSIRGFSLAKMVQRSRDVSAKLQAGVQHLLKKNKITVFEGVGKISGKGNVSIKLGNEVTGNLSAPHIILATGARPRVVPGLEPDGEFVWNYKNAMVPKELPKSLLVVGSGAIGIEFASFYRSLGVKVTVVETLDRILPVEDKEISSLAKAEFEKRSIEFFTSSTIKSLNINGGHVLATIESNGKLNEITVDKVIVAVGIVANIEGLGLEATRVRIDKGHLVVNQWLETDEPGVYAIGDLTAPPWLAHKASHEAVICVEKIAGIKNVQPLDPLKIPSCTYSFPQIASIGLSEERAKAAGFTLKIGRFPFIANGKAIALNETEGMVKTIFDAKTGELLGAHLIGAEVTELIQGYAISKTLEATEEDLMSAIFPHPTLSEAMHESVLGAFGQVIHI